MITEAANGASIMNSLSTRGAVKPEKADSTYIPRNMERISLIPENLAMTMEVLQII
jgi:hypothetical protein